MAGYVVGWNQVGQEPDFPPKRFDNSQEARRWLRDHLRWESGDHDDPHLSDLCWDYAQQLEMGLYQKFEWEFTIGDITYWVKAADPPQPNPYMNYYHGGMI